jgi:hypothetical protein
LIVPKVLSEWISNDKPIERRDVRIVRIVLSQVIFFYLASQAAFMVVFGIANAWVLGMPWQVYWSLLGALACFQLRIFRDAVDTIIRVREVGGAKQRSRT